MIFEGIYFFLSAFPQKFHIPWCWSKIHDLEGAFVENIFRNECDAQSLEWLHSPRRRRVHFVAAWISPFFHFQFDTFQYHLDFRVWAKNGFTFSRSFIAVNTDYQEFRFKNFSNLIFEIKAIFFSMENATIFPLAPCYISQKWGFTSTRR